MSSSGNEFVEFNGTVKKATDKAILFTMEDSKQEVWIPRSVIEDGDELEEDEIDQTIFVKEWFADREL